MPWPIKKMLGGLFWAPQPGTVVVLANSVRTTGPAWRGQHSSGPPGPSVERGRSGLGPLGLGTSLPGQPPSCLVSQASRC